MARPRKFDEQAVLTAARDAFWRDGYAGTSVHDLTEATGLGTQSLYGAFGSKHDLFLRVLDEYYDRQAAGLQASVAEAPTPWQALKSVITFEDEGRLALPAEGCLMSNSAGAMSAHDDDVRERACRSHTDTVALFTREVERAQDAGEIDTGVDPADTARALITVMQGLEFLRKAGVGDEELCRAKAAVLRMVDRFAGCESAPGDG